MPKCPACGYKDDDETMFSEAWNGFCTECASLEAIHAEPNAFSHEFAYKDHCDICKAKSEGWKDPAE